MLPMRTITVDVSGRIELTFDKNSSEFQEAFKDFKDCFDKDATVDSMLKHVAYNVIRFGDDRMVEGVGYVSFNGRKPDTNYSGIMVADGYDNFYLST